MPSPALVANLITARASASARRSFLGVDRESAAAKPATLARPAPVAAAGSALRVRPGSSHQYSSLNQRYGRSADTMISLEGARHANFGKACEFTRMNGIETGCAYRMRPEFGVRNMNHGKMRSRVMEVQDRTQTSTAHYWGHATT